MKCDWCKKTADHLHTVNPSTTAPKGKMPHMFLDGDDVCDSCYEDYLAKQEQCRTEL